jgi:hypothetical protein
LAITAWAPNHRIAALVTLVDKADHLRACGAHRHHPQRGTDVSGELLVPAPSHLRFHRASLQRLNAGEALNQQRLICGAALEFLLHPRLQHRRHQQ